MRVVQPPFPVGPEEGLSDVGVQVVGAVFPFVGRDPVVVLVIAAADFEPALGRVVLPHEGGVEVPVPERRISTERESVRGVIAVGLDGVVVVDVVGDTQVRVRESGRSAAVVASLLRDPLQDPVGIRGPRSRDDRRLALDDGPFHVQAAGQEADAGGPAPMVQVAGFAVDLQDRGHPPAEFRRDGTLVQFHVIDDIRVEGGEDAEQVGRIVDGVSVEQDEVLVGAAAADVEAAGGLAHGLDARKREDRLDHVALTEGGGDLVHRLHTHLLHAHLRIPVLGHALGGNDGFLQHGHLLGQDDVQSAVGMDLDPEGQLLLAVGAEVQDVLSDRQVDAVLAAAVRPGVGLGAVIEDQDPVHRLAGFGFRHGSMDPARHVPFVLSGDADGVDLVPVGGRQGIVHILDDDGVRLDFLEVAIRQAAPGSGEVRFRDAPPRRCGRMAVPGDAFQVERGRTGRCGEPPF